MSPDDRRIVADTSPPVRRARVAELIVYDVTDAELLVLEYGAPSSKTANWIAGLVGAGTSTLLTLIGATPRWPWLELPLWCVGSGALCAGVALWLARLADAREQQNVVRTIRRRAADPPA